MFKNEIVRISGKPIKDNLVDLKTFEHLYQTTITKVQDYFRLSEQKKWFGYRIKVNERVVRLLCEFGFILEVDPKFSEEPKSETEKWELKLKQEQEQEYIEEDVFEF